MDGGGLHEKKIPELISHANSPLQLLPKRSLHNKRSCGSDNRIRVSFCIQLDSRNRHAVRSRKEREMIQEESVIFDRFKA